MEMETTETGTKTKMTTASNDGQKQLEQQPLTAEAAMAVQMLPAMLAFTSAMTMICNDWVVSCKDHDLDHGMWHAKDFVTS